jgi:predicted O-methyltransferase YrrM
MNSNHGKHEFYTDVFYAPLPAPENIHLLTDSQKNDPDPNFFDCILTENLEDFNKCQNYSTTVLYFDGQKLIHDYNFARFDKIDGWFHPSEGAALFNLTQEVKNLKGYNVEIGSWRGRSTSWMLYGLKLNNDKLVCIDHFIGSEEHVDLKNNNHSTFTDFVNNLKNNGLYENAIIFGSRREKMMPLWSRTVKLIFIDGDHGKSGEDFEAFDPFIVVGGYVAFHDLNVGGYNQINKVFDAIISSGRYEKIDQVNSLGIMRKIKD